MTIEQANQYFAALPDGFASTEQLRAALTAPVGTVAFVGVAGTAGKTVVARLLRLSCMRRASTPVCTTRAVSRWQSASVSTTPRWTKVCWP